MTKKEYTKYQASVERNLKGLKHVSTGACAGCDECGLVEDCNEHERDWANEGSFSWSACDCCGSHLGGQRYPAHGRTKDNDLVHLDVCQDCLFYLNYGKLDDQSMEEMEKETE